MEKGAQQYVWEGKIPLQVHLHESEVTTLPPPSPALILAPRIGYLPLLSSQLKSFFSSALPPGVDTIWFEYKGLPLKWYIPTGVLFDLLCAEPERPWNLTVHFRGYPGDVLIPCDGEVCVKWSYINSLKEAAYIIHGSSKNVMNMSHSDQVNLWRSVMNGKLETYKCISSKLKLGIVSDALSEKLKPSPLKASRTPVRLYIWTVDEDFEDLEDASHFDSWDHISYINRPVEINREGKYLTLLDAIKSILPEFYSNSFNTINSEINNELESVSSCQPEIKLVRIQGIEPKMEIPFSWVVNNLINPDYFLHVCVYIKPPNTTTNKPFPENIFQPHVVGNSLFRRRVSTSRRSLN
ncbi:autophagy protein 5-like [Rutidosis leptorrhynchoides]|uniref:autophagy protein 5-like n=1 Tax=Rutidosis leptorrhynchoides TaxID=125765 RepID=UPI003A995431